MDISERPTYFFSDAHLLPGLPESEQVKHRKLGQLLDTIARKKARCIILGDLFDFWFEFRRGIPKGYDEMLKLLRETTERGAEIHFIGGNHDWWAGKKFTAATGVIVHHEPFIGELNGLQVYAGHGDGLAPSDWGYRNLLRPTLRNRVNVCLFKQIPRFAGQSLARIVSGGSRIYTKQRDLRLEAEYVEVARKMCARGIDIVIIGHTHEPARIVEFDRGKYVNIGDFFEQFSYGVLAEKVFELKRIC